MNEIGRLGFEISACDMMNRLIGLAAFDFTRAPPFFVRLAIPSRRAGGPGSRTCRWPSRVQLALASLCKRAGWRVGPARFARRSRLRTRPTTTRRADEPARVRPVRVWRARLAWPTRPGPSRLVSSSFVFGCPEHSPGTREPAKCRHWPPVVARPREPKWLALALSLALLGAQLQTRKLLPGFALASRDPPRLARPGKR
ncbi:Hypothetical predicted protein, partial [Olea europaea subsp. europaea]